MAWIGYLLFFLLVESCKASGCTGYKKSTIPPSTCHDQVIKYDESFLVDFGAELKISMCACRVTSRHMNSPQFDLTEKYCMLREGNPEELCKENRPKVNLLKDGGMYLKYEIIRRNNKHFLCVEVDDDNSGGDIDEESLALECLQNNSESSVRKSSSPHRNGMMPRRNGSSSNGVPSENRSSDTKTAFNPTIYRPDRLAVDKLSDEMSSGALAGIVIGVIAISALIVGLSILFLVRYRRSGSLWSKPMNIAYGTSEMDVRIVSESKTSRDGPSSNYYSSYLVSTPNLEEGKKTSQELKKEKSRPPMAPPRPKVFTRKNAKEPNDSDPCIGVNNAHYIEPIGPSKSTDSSHDQLRPEYSNSKQCTDNDYLTPINSDSSTINEYVEPTLIENASKTTDEHRQEGPNTNTAFTESESIYETIA